MNDTSVLEVQADTPYEAALRLVCGGTSVIPIGTEKRPSIATWKPFQERLATSAELKTWFAQGQNGLAIVAGAVSGNIEVLDFDDRTTLEPWEAMVNALAPGLVERLVIVETPKGGRHLYYRCGTIAGNQKLAVSAARETMIETRGEGGYALIPPSPAWCHPLHKEYVLVQGDLAEIPTITESEREILLNCARALTEYVEPERIYEPNQDTTASGERPGDLYAKAVTWGEILEPHGWKLISQQGEYGTWRRPGKEYGLSATTGFNGSDLLYVFSSNAAPFEPQRGYSKFTAYALLNHGGDFKKAATALAAAGYTKSAAQEDEGSELGGVTEDGERFWDRIVFPVRKKRTQKPEVKRDPPVVIPMAEFAAKEMTPMNELMYWGPFVFKGYLTFCVGESSAGKTVFFYRLAQALTAGKAFLGFAPYKPLRVLHIELENGDELAKHVAKVMKFHPTGWDRIGEPATYDEVIALGKGYDVIIIDSLQKFDKPKDENDNGEANAQMAQFHRVKEETGAAVIVTHNAGKGGDGTKFKMRGASARVDLSDVVFNMDITGPEARKLTIVKTRFEGLNETVEYRFADDLDFKLIQGLTVTSDKTKDFIWRIQEIVPSDGSISRGEVLAALGIKEKSPDASAIDRALDTMVKLGELQKQGRGNYSRREASPVEG